jgi:hypothetical protein
MTDLVRVGQTIFVHVIRLCSCVKFQNKIGIQNRIRNALISRQQTGPVLQHRYLVL